MSSPLYVVTALSNAGNFKIRYKLHDEWAKRVLDAGAIPVTVECAYPGQTHQAKAIGPGHKIIQVRAQSIMWHKENLLNIGFQHLPAYAEYVSWQDCDVQLIRPDWVGRTINRLTLQPVIQMFSSACDLFPDYTPCYPIPSYVAAFQGSYKVRISATGFAWAARASWLKAMGGLCEALPVSDDSDSITAKLLCGRLSIIDSFGDWAMRLQSDLRAGCLTGLILHHWHGSRKHRQGAKEQHLKRINELNFTPDDLTHNSDGVLEFKDPDSPIAKYMQSYFQSRNEDSVETFGSELQF